MGNTTIIIISLLWVLTSDLSVTTLLTSTLPSAQQTTTCLHVNGVLTKCILNQDTYYVLGYH